MPQIPTACITVEDAEMMSRMVSRGSKIVIQLKMGAKNYPDADSFNTVAEIIGSKYPEQVSERDSKVSGKRVLWLRENVSLQRWSLYTYSLQMLHIYIHFPSEVLLH